MDSMQKCLVFLLLIATLSYVFIYISTSESIELFSRERRDIRDRKPILPKEQLLDESVASKNEIDGEPNKIVWMQLQLSPSKTKGVNYFQSLARKVDSRAGDKKMTHNERQDSLNYTMESSLINSDANMYPKEKNYTIFIEKESKIMKSMNIRYDVRNIRDVNHFQDKRKLETFSERKSQGNTTYEIQREACKVSFDKDSLNNARQFLYQSEKQSVYLFYVHLQIQNISDFSSDYREIDKLSNWQYVLKDQKFLAQLPVDFDLVTFSLLSRDRDEEFINLKAFYNNKNCTQDSIKTIEYTKIILWNELFNNDTMYFLCNRHYHEIVLRNILYYVATIWIGYDLTCSEAPTEIGTYEFDVEKNDLLSVIPIVAFLLSLEFVWIFAVLDVWSSNLKDAEKHKHSEKGANHKEKSEFFYEKGDRPFGIKRVLIKLFYYKSECCKAHDSNTIRDKLKRFFCCCYPQRRLLCLLWIFILFPFGFRRTFCRYKINSGTYDEYPNILRTSEPMFYAINGGQLTLKFDIIYAILCPISFIWVGPYFYSVYISKQKRKCTNSKDHETKPTREITGFSDSVVSGCNVLFSSYEKDIPKTCRILRIFCGFILGILSLFPIFSIFFSFRFEYLQCENSNKNANEKPQKTGRKSAGESHAFDIRAKCCRIMEAFCCLICFVGSYFLCLRPILSTFTFLLRFVTYFLFVLLPIRLSIFRYTFIIFSAIVYLAKYLHEFINMNSAILDYIFEKDNEQQIDKSSTNGTEAKKEGNMSMTKDVAKTPTETEIKNVVENETQVESKISVENAKPKPIDEEKFTYIYINLLFVKKKFYFFVLKTLIVFAYLIITIETFLSNKDSLTSTSFKDIVEIVLVFSGPYAISLFFKGNSEDFLTDDDKKDIDIAYEQYMYNSSQENPTLKTHKENGNNETKSTGNQLSGNQHRNTPTQSIGAQPTNDSSNSVSLRVSVHVHSESKESTSSKSSECIPLLQNNK